MSEEEKLSKFSGLSKCLTIGDVICIDGDIKILITKSLNNKKNGRLFNVRVQAPKDKHIFFKKFDEVVK